MPLGETLAQSPIDKFKGVKGFTKRIGIISIESIIGAKTHYSEELRKKFFCFEGSCCKYDDPMVHYIFPVVEYETNQRGELISRQFAVRYLAATPKVYEMLILINKTSPLDTIDLYVTCSDEGWQNNTYMNAGPAVWRSDQQLLTAVWNEYQRLAPHIENSLAKKLGDTADECENVYRYMKDRAASAPAQGGPAAPPVSKFDLNAFSNTPPQAK